jgi:hypothetical protein
VQILLNRKECRRRILARMGFATSDEQAQMVMPQLNETIRAACDAVYLLCPWVRTLRETRLDVGIDQRFINYPDNCGPENIQSLAVWDADGERFLQLRRCTIPVELDDEPVVEVGEPGSVANRGRPDRYEAKDQIEVWRRPDQAYRLKCDHTINPNFEDDDQQSIVDAELIILWAMADRYDTDGEDRLAAVQRQKFKDRFGVLAGLQRSWATVTRDSGRRARMQAFAHRQPGYVPTSGAWPSVMPE